MRLRNHYQVPRFLLHDINYNNKHNDYINYYNKLDHNYDKYNHNHYTHRDANYHSTLRYQMHVASDAQLLKAWRD